MSASTPLTYTVFGPAAVAIDPNTGVITWQTTEADGPGIYSIQTVVTDSHSPPLSSTNIFNVVVNEVNSAPLLPAQKDRFIAPLTTLIITNTATDLDIPTNTLSYVLANPPAWATITPNGIITLTPTLAADGTTNTITTVVTDNGLPSLSATNSFSVIVTTNLPPIPPHGFTLVQYNVKGNGVTNPADWSTNAPQVQAIGRELTYLNPDIITFNEIPVAGAGEMTNWGKAFLSGYNIVVSPGTDGYIGSAIASRFPILRATSWLDGADLNPYGYTASDFTRDLFEAEIIVPGYAQPLHVFTTHLKSTAGRRLYGCRSQARRRSRCHHEFLRHEFLRSLPERSLHAVRGHE